MKDKAQKPHPSPLFNYASSKAAIPGKTLPSNNIKALISWISMI
jgi:hypothetical protein